MTDKCWHGQYVDGDANNIIIDASLSLNELRLIVSELEAGTIIHWKPYRLMDETTADMEVINEM